MIVLSKRRLKNIVASRCSCENPEYQYKFTHDIFDVSITLECTSCGKKEKSKPEVVHSTGRRRKTSIYRTNIALIYLSVIDDTGAAGVKRMLGALGMRTMGNFKYYRHLQYMFGEMKTYFNMKQDIIHDMIRQYYGEHTDTIPDEDNNMKIDVSYDGSWMKRGHTSRIGMGVVIEVRTGFIVDFEVLSKFCHACSQREARLREKKITQEQFDTWKTTHNDCKKNYEGTSGGMETEGAVRMFGRSTTNKFKYEHFIGDGDSSAYKAVIALNNGKGPYDDTQVIKLECINHVQKRMGTRLRKMRDEEKTEVTTKKGTTIRRAVLGGRNKLSDKAIDTMTAYFGQHIRANVGKTYQEMKTAVMSSFYHIFSTDENPRHDLCAKGTTSWCFYQKALAQGKTAEDIKHKKTLIINVGEDGEEKIKSVYQALTSQDLLERCVRGLTQNANESFHSKMWARARKAKFAGLSRLHFVAQTAILDHNFGYQKASLLTKFELNFMGLQKVFKHQDTERRRHSKGEKSRPKTKDQEKQQQQQQDYAAGAF